MIIIYQTPYAEKNAVVLWISSSISWSFSGSWFSEDSSSSEELFSLEDSWRAKRSSEQVEGVIPFVFLLNELVNIAEHKAYFVTMRMLLKVIKNIEYSLLLLENREEKNSIQVYSSTFHRGSLYEDRYETQKKYISFGNSSLINRRISSLSFPSRYSFLGYLLRERLTKLFFNTSLFKIRYRNTFRRN